MGLCQNKTSDKITTPSTIPHCSDPLSPLVLWSRPCPFVQRPPFAQPPDTCHSPTPLCVGTGTGPAWGAAWAPGEWQPERPQTRSSCTSSPRASPPLCSVSRTLVHRNPPSPLPGSPPFLCSPPPVFQRRGLGLGVCRLKMLLLRNSTLFKHPLPPPRSGRSEAAAGSAPWSRQVEVQDPRRPPALGLLRAPGVHVLRSLRALHGVSFSPTSFPTLTFPGLRLPPAPPGLPPSSDLCPPPAHGAPCPPHHAPRCPPSLFSPGTSETTAHKAPASVFIELLLWGRGRTQWTQTLG